MAMVLHFIMLALKMGTPFVLSKEDFVDAKLYCYLKHHSLKKKKITPLLVISFKKTVNSSGKSRIFII